MEGGVSCLDVVEDGRKQDFIAGGVMGDEMWSSSGGAGWR